MVSDYSYLYLGLFFYYSSFLQRSLTRRMKNSKTSMDLKDLDKV